MLRRTRVATSPDLTRISAGVQRPGIDLRINNSLAFALEESTIDKEHGHYVDVKLIPSELELTCRVPEEYAGKDFGTHEGTIHKGDELYVSIPEGDPALGPFVLARVWSKMYPPPKLVQDHPTDIVRVVEKDKAYRLLLQGEKGLIDGELSATIDLRMLTDKAKVTLEIGDYKVIIDNTSSPTKLTFKTEGGDILSMVKTAEEGLKLGVSPDDHMALAKLVKDELKALRTTINANADKFDAHKHEVSGIKTAGSPASHTQTAPKDTAVPGNAPATQADPINDVKSEFVMSK